MKKLNVKYSLCIVLLTVLICHFLIGCESFVEVDLPPNQLTGEGIFDENRTAEAAVTDMYAYQRSDGLLKGLGSGLSITMALYTDELERYGSSDGNDFEFNTHNVQPNNAIVGELWNSSYKTIYLANAAIHGIESSISLNREIADELLGQAYFMRAFMHFYLTDLFGDVPYITTTAYEVNQIVSKNTSEEVLRLITQDLIRAKELIPEPYQSQERIRPNKSTVKALLSRVYLRTGQWELAQKVSTEILETGLYSIDIPIDEVFLKDSPGTIWQFKPEFSGYNTLEAQTFIILAPRDQFIVLSQTFVDSFEANDLRRTQWIDSISTVASPLYFPCKYKEYSPTPTSLEYSKIFRIAEIYLNRAEAFLKVGEMERAKDDINAVRARAGLAEITTKNISELDGVLLQERKAELFTEFGHRWFDLKRFDKAKVVLSPIKSGWDNSSYLFPIPETEINANPNLEPQNPGY